jgi:peptidoglycan hydrolase CwlO-like protein
MPATSEPRHHIRIEKDRMETPQQALTQQDAQRMLNALLDMTGQQSGTTEKLLVELKGQIAALAVAAKITQNAAASVGQSAASVEQAARNAAPALQQAAAEAVGDAVASAVERALTGASSAVVASMEQAATPMLDKFSGAAAATTEAEDRLHQATASFGWKWLAIAGGTLLCTLSVFMLVAWLGIWLQRFQINELAEQKVRLQSDIAQLQDQVTLLTKKGGRIKLAKCGERLCVEASSNQGAKHPQWSGPWRNNTNGAPMVIPAGY